MKKLSFVLGILLLANTAFAGIVSIDSLASDTGITFSWFNNSMNAIKTEINGNIESINIKDGTINSADIATAANPLKRDGENIGEYVYSGLTIADSASVAITIAAGVAYVQNDANGYLHRVETASTNKSVTGTKDTWIYLDFAGSFVYEEVAVGAAEPTTPANSLLIALASNPAGAATTITDKRRTTPQNLRIYTNYRNGVILSYDTAATIKVLSGDIELGTTGKMRKNTTPLSLAWTDVDTGVTESAATYYYVYAYPDPTSSVTYKGMIGSSVNGLTSVTDERLIGWFYNENGSDISRDSVGNYKGDGSPAWNMARANSDRNEIVAGTAWEELTNARARFYSSGRPLRISINWLGTSSNANEVMQCTGYVDSISNDSFLTFTGNRVPANGAAISAQEGGSSSWIVLLPAGEHYANLGARTQAAAATITRQSIIIEEL